MTETRGVCKILSPILNQCYIPVYVWGWLLQPVMYYRPLCVTVGISIFFGIPPTVLYKHAPYFGNHQFGAHSVGGCAFLCLEPTGTKQCKCAARPESLLWPWPSWSVPSNLWSCCPCGEILWATQGEEGVSTPLSSTNSDLWILEWKRSYIVLFPLFQASSNDIHGEGGEREAEKTREKTWRWGNFAAGHMGEVHHPHQTPGETAWFFGCCSFFNICNQTLFSDRFFLLISMVDNKGDVLSLL